ncbi:hypothetical protein BDN70DRAFT_927373 [Pholiota conissans]|uniref:Uncharacterized protein n=1 Tax=Pholiota conissans TaxID=109636 RepID=A0A9P6CYW9_9AGAR|nr:hypothetical protein BDN70DRAFT_927373 [Pholiota conissans]
MSSTNPTFTHLHTLRINTPSRGENWNDIEYFILGLAPTLETLELRIGTVHSGSFHTILFNKLQRLTTFKVYAELESDLLDPFFLPEDLWAICQFIRCAATLSQLKAIHIGFLFTILTGSASFAQPHQASNSGFISNTAWKDLDAELSWSKPGFVALNYISLQIEKYYHCDKASTDGTRIKDADSNNITVSNILPLTCQRLTLRETDFGVYSIYTADSMPELVEHWF